MLHLVLSPVNGTDTGQHEGRQHGLQVGACREHLVGRPDHQALVAAVGQVQRQHQTFDHAGADGVHLGFDAGDEHATSGALRVFGKCPDADRLVFMQRLARRFGAGCIGAQHTLGEVLACIHRQLAHGHELARGRVPRALRRVHAAFAAIGLGHRASEHPIRQGRIAQGFACVNVGLDHVGHIQPTGFLPQFKRALLHAEAPAHAEVNVAGVVGDLTQMDSGVVKAVA